MPPITGDPTTATGPFLAARVVLVKAPLLLEFQGSSFLTTWNILQSIMENWPPWTAKLPPNFGAVVLTAIKLPRSLWFRLENCEHLWLLEKCHHLCYPSQRPPPQSSIIHQARLLHIFLHLDFNFFPCKSTPIQRKTHFSVEILQIRKGVARYIQSTKRKKFSKLYWAKFASELNER